MNMSDIPLHERIHDGLSSGLDAIARHPTLRGMLERAGVTDPDG
jgi:hypothetical protein